MGFGVRKLKNVWHWINSWLWVYYFGYPARRLTVIGVTGTDGKTTTANLIYEILMAAGHKTGLVSTVWAKVGGRIVDMALHVTSPDPRVLQGLIKQMADEGCTHAVLEVTSHGLDQYRTVGCNFWVGVLTNISHEHLDYHGTMAKYVEAKVRLFADARYAVLNKDEKWAEVIASRCRGEVVWYGKTKLKDMSRALGGEYNKYNIGAAQAAAKILGVYDDKIRRVVQEFAGVPGRREDVEMGQKFRCVVDFAHTPNALERLLMSLRKELGKNKLILVFGCTGERDKAKRPVMGEIAAKLADVVVITSDDVRGESQDQIYEQIMAGVTERLRARVTKENNRDKAIEMAVKKARPGDIVVAAGMGHETTQLVGKTEVKRSDRWAFEKAITDVLR